MRKGVVGAAGLEPALIAETDFESEYKTLCSLNITLRNRMDVSGTGRECYDAPAPHSLINRLPVQPWRGIPRSLCAIDQSQARKGGKEVSRDLWAFERDVHAIRTAFPRATAATAMNGIAVQSGSIL